MSHCVISHRVISLVHLIDITPILGVISHVDRLMSLPYPVISLACDGRPSDITRPPCDITRQPSDITRPPCDITRQPSDITRPPCDITRRPSDITRPPPSDITRRPSDITRPPATSHADRLISDVGDEVYHSRCSTAHVLTQERVLRRSRSAEQTSPVVAR